MSGPLATSKGLIAIRPAIPGDAVLLRELRLEALASHPEAFAADYDATAAQSAEGWVDRITSYAADKKGVITLAAAESRLIGMAGLACGNWPKTRHSGTIWGVYVQANWRGFHVAEALLRGCMAWVQAQDLVIVKLGVITTNTAAIRCYARCGFTVYGIEPKVICYNGFFYDELLMAKAI